MTAASKDVIVAAADALWAECLNMQIMNYRDCEAVASVAVAAIAKHDREGAARALRKAADDWQAKDDVFRRDRPVWEWLRAQAEQVDLEAMESEDDSTLIWVSRKTGERVSGDEPERKDEADYDSGYPYLG